MRPDFQQEWSDAIEDLLRYGTITVDEFCDRIQNVIREIARADSYEIKQELLSLEDENIDISDLRDLL